MLTPPPFAAGVAGPVTGCTAGGAELALAGGVAAAPLADGLLGGAAVFPWWVPEPTSQMPSPARASTTTTNNSLCWPLDSSMPGLATCPGGPAVARTAA